MTDDPRAQDCLDAVIAGPSAVNWTANNLGYTIADVYGTALEAAQWRYTPDGAYSTGYDLLSAVEHACDAWMQR